MIAAVSAKPASSSAPRMAPTRPSIMSDGRDQVGAGPGVRDRHAAEQRQRRVVEHVRRRAPARRSGRGWCTAQRQTSVAMTSSGATPRIARIASGTGPASSHAPEPSLVLGRRQAEQQHAADAGLGAARPPPPRPRRATGARRPAATARGRRTPLPGTTNRGRMSWAGSRDVSRTRRRRPSRRRRRRGRVTGNVNAAPGVGRPRAVSARFPPRRLQREALRGRGGKRVGYRRGRRRKSRPGRQRSPATDNVAALRERRRWSRISGRRPSRTPSAVADIGASWNRRPRSPTSAPVIQRERGPARSDEGAKGLSTGATRRGPWSGAHDRCRGATCWRPSESAAPRLFAARSGHGRRRGSR